MSINIKRAIKILGEFISVTLVISGVIGLCYIFIVKRLEVSGKSMYPTFNDKEQLIAEKLSIKYNDLKHGEIVIFDHPTQKGYLLIKRIIAKPGDVFMLKDGYITLNGKVLSEPYLVPNTKTFGNIFINDNVEYKVPDDSFLMLGDNREKSTDSRFWGYINKKSIIGRGFLVYYPLKDLRFIK